MLPGILHCVGQQVKDRLLEGVTIHGNRRNSFAHTQIQHEALLGQWILDRLHSGLNDFGQRDWLQLIGLLPALDARKIEHIVQQASQALALADERTGSDALRLARIGSTAARASQSSSDAHDLPLLGVVLG